MLHPDLKFVGDEILKTPALRVTEVDEAVLQLISKMFTVMKEANGIGLAANQIGSNLSIFITNIRGRDEVYINPAIEELDEPVFFKEGCLSIPGVQDQTKRYNRVIVTFQTPEDLQYTLREEFEGVPAIVMQHEIDHLNGKLYIDHFNQYRRSAVMKKFRKVMKNYK